MNLEQYAQLKDQVFDRLLSDSGNDTGGYYHALGVVHIAQNGDLVEEWPALERFDPKRVWLVGTYIEHSQYHGGTSLYTLEEWLKEKEEYDEDMGDA